MPVTTITDDFYTVTGIRLSSSSFLNLFNILMDDDNNKFMNIFRSYILRTDITQDTVYYYTYNTEPDDWWDNISTKFYETPYLWWIICLMNNVMNPFEELEEGTELKILKDTYIYQLLNEIREISEQ